MIAKPDKVCGISSEFYLDWSPIYVSHAYPLLDSNIIAKFSYNDRGRVIRDKEKYNQTNKQNIRINLICFLDIVLTTSLLIKFEEKIILSD